MKNAIINWVVRRAKRTPYYDLPGYMLRYWLVPYSREIIHGDGKLHGTGRVKWYRRPFSRLLQFFNISARVHVILRSDTGRDFHDHPWNYCTIILRGGYWEYTPNGARWRGPGSVLFRKASSWHRLGVPAGGNAVTIFITGKRIQRWGFLVNGKKVPYTEYEGLSAV